MSRTISILLICLVLMAVPFQSEIAAEEVVYFGVIPRYNPIIMYRSYQPMMDYLTAHTDYRFELKLTRNYQQTVESLRNGETTFAALGVVTYAQAHLQFGAVPILKPLNQSGEPFYRSIIIVQKDSPIQTVADLRGQRFAFGDPHSTSGHFIARGYLDAQGLSLSALESFAYLESHDAVAKAVLKGQADAGAVKDVVARRYQQHGLRFLAQSELIPGVPIVARKETPAALVEAVKTALLKIDPLDPATQQFLSGWDPEFSHGFEPAEPEDYRDILTTIKNYRQGCGLQCH